MNWRARYWREGQQIYCIDVAAVSAFEARRALENAENALPHHHEMWGADAITFGPRRS